MREVNPRKLKVLAALLNAKRPPSLRELAAMFGWTSPNSVTEVLRELKSDGMVDWEMKNARTLRATCRFISAKELELAEKERAKV